MENSENTLSNNSYEKTENESKSNGTTHISNNDHEIANLNDETNSIADKMIPESENDKSENSISRHSEKDDNLESNNEHSVNSNDVNQDKAADSNTQGDEEENSKKNNDEEEKSSHSKTKDENENSENVTQNTQNPDDQSEHENSNNNINNGTYAFYNESNTIYSDKGTEVNEENKDFQNFQNDYQQLEPQLPPIRNLRSFTSKEVSPNNKKHNETSYSDHKGFQDFTFKIDQPQKPKGFSHSARPVYKKPPPLPKPSEHMEDLMRKAMNHDDLSGETEETYNELILYLQQARKQYVIEHNYNEGAKINGAIQLVEKYKTALQKQYYAKVAIEEYQDQLASFEAQRDEFDRETQEKIKKLEKVHKRKRQELEELHQKQLLTHQQHWTSPTKFRLYNRGSNELKFLRRQHADLLVQCRFEEAKRLNREINEKMEVEERNNHAIYQHEYEESYALLQQKQRDEDEFLENKIAVEMAALIQRRAKERRVFDNKEKKIKSQENMVKDPEKIWNHKQLQRIEEATARGLQPSSRITRRDIRDREVVLLRLPPLRLNTPCTGMRKSK